MDDFDNIKWIKVTPESVDLYNVDGTFKRLPDSIIQPVLLTGVIPMMSVL